MADQPLVTGGRERVALEIYQYLRQGLPDTRDGAIGAVAKKHLDLYAECLKAVRGTAYDTSGLTP